MASIAGLLLALAVTSAAAEEAAPGDASAAAIPTLALDRGNELATALRLSGTDAESAERKLAELRAAQPNLADVIAVSAARAWMRIGEGVRADAAAARGLEAGPSNRLRAALEALRAEAAAARGEEGVARAAWTRAVAAAKKRDERARYRFAIAESHERSAEIEAAVAIYRDLWVASPTTGEASRAATRLDELERLPDIDPRVAKDALRRADRLFSARRSAAALAAYERSLRGKLGARSTRHAAMRRAQSLFRVRRYPDAVDAFAAIPGAEARFWRARSLARAGRVEDAIDLFEAIAGNQKARRSTWARYLAAILHEGRERHDHAGAHFERLLQNGGEIGRNARWRLAWRAYRDDNFKRARAHFTRLAKQSADPIDRLRPRYWAARSLESGDAKRATAELRGIVREFPLTYYALQSRRVLGDVEVTAMRNRIAADPALLSDADLFRARVAIAAGEHEVALLLLAELRPRAKRIRDRLALAQLYHAAGDSYPALQLVVVPYSGLLAKGIDPDLPELWEAAWPRPFAQLVKEWSPEGLDTSVVWSVMREESGFRIEVESITGAIGLLQIQPKTGNRLAREVGLEAFAPAHLAEPATNVRLGAFYLHQLAAEFEGSLPAAIASYNAGENAVRTWIETGDDPESDVWIESIPYTQTRNYVKRVLRNLVFYRALEPDASAVPIPEPDSIASTEIPQKPASQAADSGGDEAQ